MSIAELAHEAVEALSPVAHRMDVDVQLDSDGPAVVMASTTDVSRVLRNLLENAIGHSPSGEAVRVVDPHGPPSRGPVSTTRAPAFPMNFVTTPLSRSPAPTLHGTPARGTQVLAWRLPERLWKRTADASGWRGAGWRRDFSIPERNQHDRITCLTSVDSVSPPPTTAVGATAEPRRYGALAGLVSGAVAVTIWMLFARVIDVVSPIDAVGSEFIDRVRRG